MSSKSTNPIQKIRMTPALAAELLKDNTHNRPVSNGAIGRYANDMKAGLWVFNGDAIRVDTNGVLLDGQHRLLACVRSGVEFDCVMVTGLEPEVFSTLDAGNKRSAGAVLSISGVSDASVVASSARLVINYLKGVASNQSCGTPAIVDFVQDQPDIKWAAHQGRSVYKVMSSSIMGAVMFIGSRAQGFEKRAVSFVEGVSSGIDLKEGDPRLALRNAFISMHLRTGNKTRPHTGWAWGICVSTWNAYIQQRSLMNVKVQTKDGKYTNHTILGGPAFGSGVDELKSFKLHHQVVKSQIRKGLLDEAELLS